MQGISFGGSATTPQFPISKFQYKVAMKYRSISYFTFSLGKIQAKSKYWQPFIWHLPHLIMKFYFWYTCLMTGCPFQKWSCYLKGRSPYFAISLPPAKLLCHWEKRRENSVILKMSNYDPVPWQDVTDKISQWLWTPYSEANCGASDQYKGKFASSSHILTYSLSLETTGCCMGNFVFSKKNVTNSAYSVFEIVSLLKTFCILEIYLYGTLCM